MQKEGTNIAILGVSGYAGAELARLLLHHPRLRKNPPLCWAAIRRRRP